MAMNPKAPSSVMNMVKDISGQLKDVFKTLRWQDGQKRELVEHRLKVVESLEKEEKHLERESARVEQELKERKAVLKKMEEREAQLRAELKTLTRGAEKGRGDHGRGESSRHPWMAGGAAQGGSPRGGPMSSAFYKGMAAHSPANSFLGLDSSRR